MKKIKAILLCTLVALAAVGVAACAGKPKYTVTFDTRGGSAVAALRLKEGATVSRPANPVKELFRFDGWYADADCTEVYPFGAMPAHDVTVYAGWIPEQSVKVVFDANGGAYADGVKFAAVGKVGDAFTAPAQNPTYEGYVFDGWYTEPSCQTRYEFYAYPESGFTLYAGWERDPSYTYVSYYGNGELLGVQPVRKGETVVARDFFDADTVTLGWFADAEITQPSGLFGTAATADATVYTRYYTKGLVIENGVVTGYNGNSRAVVVPDRFDGVAVTEIGAYAFYAASEASSIQSVQLPTTVTKIAEGAFYDCSALVSVNLSSAVTSLGARAFYNNSRLRSLGDISSVTRIEEGVFAGCQNLKSIVLSERVTAIGASAFVGCSSLVSFTVPSGVRTIDDGLWKDCSSLVSVDITAPVLSTFGQNVFDGCAALLNVTIRSAAVPDFGDRNQDGFTTPFAALDDVRVFVPVGVAQQYKSLLGYLDGGTFDAKIEEIAQ